MSSIWLENLNPEIKTISVSGSEFKHIRALRKNPGDRVFITDGKGISAEGQIREIGKEFATIEAVQYFFELNEPKIRIGLALAIIDNKDRLEFALEKGIELGITDFYPLITKYTQQGRAGLKAERLKAKAISALKQCGRTRLPEIHEAMELSKIEELSRIYPENFVLDISGMNPNRIIPKGDFIVIVGPEGGLSLDELDYLNNLDIFQIVKISNRILRAETAAISALAVLTSKLI